MKKLIGFSALLLLTALFYWGCKKNNDVAVLNSTNNMAAFNALIKQIADAKTFFMNNVDTNVVQKFKKTALWDKAGVAHLKTGDQVIIPLKYDKNYTFISSFGGGNKLSLETQSHLTVYKTSSGNYKAEIINYMPDESFLNKTVSSFSGFVSASDWSDNIIGMRKYINGQVAPMQRKNISDYTQAKSGPNAENEFEEDCTDGYTDYYWCDNGWNTIGDCTFLFSVCNSNVESLGSGEGGLGDFDAPKDFPETWTVFKRAGMSDSTKVVIVNSYEILTVDHVPSTDPTLPYQSIFTAITHNGSQIVGLPHSYTYNETHWDKEFFSPYRSISSLVGGNLVDTQDPTFNPLINNTKNTWSIYDVDQ